MSSLDLKIMNNSKENLKIVQVEISELKSAEYNPRQWTKKDVDDLSESIKRFGVVEPILINSNPKRKNIVIGGHFRAEVAKTLGYKKIPAVYVDIADLKKEQELNLRLNKNQGGWDWDMLANFDESMLLEVGFGEEELGEHWDGMLEAEDDGFNVKKALEEIKVPKTKEGDIYELGNHRLMCGDSTDKDSVLKLIGEEKIDMIYCDPPYNIGLDYSSGIGGQRKYVNDRYPDLKYKGVKTNDKKTIEEYSSFLDKTIKNAIAVAKPDFHIFYWCDENYIGLVQELYKINGINLKRVALWIKNNFNVTPQIAFNKVYEPCVYGGVGKPYLNDSFKNLSEILNKEIASGNQAIDDILEIINIWLVRRDNTQDYEHPTQKPVELNQKPISRCSKVGDKILDLFGGSGSTLVACEQLKRQSFLMEHEPIFCDVIIKRYEELTKRQAKKIN